jgi:hypothetical protein
MNIRNSRSHATFRMVYNSGSFRDSLFAAALPFYIITYSNEGGDNCELLSSFGLRCTV